MVRGITVRKSIDELPVVRRRQSTTWGFGPPELVTSSWSTACPAAIRSIAFVPRNNSSRRKRCDQLIRCWWSYEPEQRLDFRDVVALSRHKIVSGLMHVRTLNTGASLCCRQAGVQRLRKHRRHTDGSQECGLAGHVRTGDQYAAPQLEADAVVLHRPRADGGYQRRIAGVPAGRKCGRVQSLRPAGKDATLIAASTSPIAMTSPQQPGAMFPDEAPWRRSTRRSRRGEKPGSGTRRCCWQRR